MAIQSITVQPIADSFHAAYRPIVLTVTATANLGGGPVPPVVYCDIYFNDVYYKTLSKTQYTTSGGSNSTWQFDIQDAAQEYLEKYIAPLGQSSVEEVEEIVTKAMCMFRCSGFDTNGFIVSDGTAPVQATSSSEAVSGTGTESNEFYIVNATLHHIDTQDLLTHLSYYKNGTWVPDVHPLTHRPNGYAIGPEDSDQFPILDTGDRTIQTMRLNYRNCNQNVFGQATQSIIATPQCTAVISPPTAQQNSLGILISWHLVSGTPGKYYVSTPAASGGAPMEVFTTQAQFGVLPAGDHTFTVTPLCLISGQYYPGPSQQVTVTVEECVAVEWSDGEPNLPTAVQDTVYDELFALDGSIPFTISAITAPAWLTVEISGANVHLFGTPDSGDLGTNIPVEFTVENDCGTFDFTGTIDVVEPATGGTVTITNARNGASITAVSPTFWNNQVGSFPLGNGQSVTGDLVPFTGTIAVTVNLVSGTAQIRVEIDGSPIEFVPVSGSGTFTVPSHTYSAGDDVLVVLTP